MKRPSGPGLTGRGKYFRQKENEGLLFISLWLAGFIVFRLFPSVFSLVFSFSDFNLFGGIEKWGFMNYIGIAADKKITASFAVTVKYAAITVPLKLIAALLAALLLNHAVKGIGFFRTVFYIPTVLGSSAAIAILWKALFRDDGLVNQFLVLLGHEKISWLSDTGNAIWVISFLRIWQFGSSMVVFLAALKAVPHELYEAAEIDGAGTIRKFFTITVPFLSPVIFYNMVTQTGLAFQEFNAPFVITQGGPRGSTTLISLLIYNIAFQEKNMGMACALTWVFFIVVSMIGALMFISQKYWVYYDGTPREEK